MSNKTLLPLYHIYVECKENFSWADDCNKKMSGKCHLFAMVNDELSNIQRALDSPHEHLSHINAQVTELFFVAIPCSNFSFTDFLQFAQIDEDEIIGAVQIFNPSTKQLSVCVKFRRINDTQQCFLQCHGKRFKSKNTEICHVLFAANFEFVFAEELKNRFEQMSLCKYLELPLCPSCLERLDPNITSVCSHTCLNHRFDANANIPTICKCTNRWQRIQCPVCHKINDQINKKQKEKEECKESGSTKKNECCQKIDDLWVCLICGHFGCGRFKQSHALQHYKETSHSFCVKLTTLSIWDYKN